MVMTVTFVNDGRSGAVVVVTWRLHLPAPIYGVHACPWGPGLGRVRCWLGLFSELPSCVVVTSSPKLSWDQTYSGAMFCLFL